MEKRIIIRSICCLLTLLAMIWGTGCSHEPDQQVNPDDTAAGKIFGNGSDARLAQITTDDKQLLTFFGTRDADGMPLRMTGYKLQSPTDPTQTDFVMLDKKGRFLDIISRTGFKIHFRYSTADSASIVVLMPDNTIRTVTLGVISAGFKSTGPLLGTNGVSSSKPNSTGLSLSTNGVSSAKTTGSTPTLRIKVVARNSAGQERDLDGAEGSVFMDMVGLQGQQYSVPAYYNALPTPGGVYNYFSVVVPTNGFALTQYGDALVTKTYDVIQEGLGLICYKQGAVIKALLTGICVGTVPEALPLCAIIPEIVVACTLKPNAEVAEKVLKSLAKLKAKDIDVSYDVAVDSPATAWFTSSLFGRVNGTTTTIRQALASQNSNNAFDIKITCTDKCGVPSISGRWQRSSDNLIFTILQSGNTINISGSSNTFAHSGTASWSACSSFIGGLLRVNRANGCSTRLSMNVTANSNQQITIQFAGLDNICDLTTSYRETNTYSKIP